MRKHGVQETKTSTQDCGKREVSDVSCETEGCSIWRGSLAINSMTEGLKKKNNLRKLQKHIILLSI